MAKKSRFEDVVKDVTEQFKKIEERNERLIKQSKKEVKPTSSQSTLREQKFKQHQEAEKTHIKGKLKT